MFEIDVEDVAAMICTYTEGPLVEIHLGYLERPARRGFVIVGEDSTMEWEGTPGFLVVKGREAAASQTFSPPAAFERNAMFLDEMRHVLSVLAGAEPKDRIPLTPGRDALDVIEATKRSVRGRRPVPLGSGRDAFDLTGRVAMVTARTVARFGRIDVLVNNAAMIRKLVQAGALPGVDGTTGRSDLFFLGRACAAHEHTNPGQRRAEQQQ